MVDNKSYDPFGKPRKGTFDLNELINSASLQTVAFADAFELITQRGFTDHEHLDDAELIHMNGRVYDYNIARFLSVDPLIHAEGGSQGINPYSYIMNNPLSGTDPSGYDPNGLKEETIKVSGEVATYTDSKGNTYVDTGDGGGLVKVSSITKNYSSGKSETTSYSNGKETSTSVTSASATSNISDIGSQQQLSQYQSDVFSDDTRTFNGDNEFEPGLSQNGVQVAVAPVILGILGKEIAGEIFEQTTGLPAPIVKGLGKAAIKKFAAKKVLKRDLTKGPHASDNKIQKVIDRTVHGNKSGTQSRWNSKEAAQRAANQNTGGVHSVSIGKGDGMLVTPLPNRGGVMIRDADRAVTIPKKMEIFTHFR